MLKNYFKTALKVLLRRKFFTFISLFAISFTLVVLMTAAAIMDHVFAPMPPESNIGRTLLVSSMMMQGEQSTWIGDAGYGFLNNTARNIPNVERFSIFSKNEEASSYKDGYEIKPFMMYTDPEYWKILDFTFLEGGPFSADDDRDANMVAVINRATRTKFFGTEAALGKFIELDQRQFRIVGVVEDVSVLRETAFSDVWAPIGCYPQAGFRSQLMGGFQAMFLARSSADFPGIKAEFVSRLGSVQFPDKEYNRMAGEPVTRFESVANDATDARPGEANGGMFVGILIAAMILFMLLPTINLININVSRIIERASEIGVRKSFGASSLTLVGQFVVENLILTFIGGIVGFILSFLVLDLLSASNLIPYAVFHMNFRIFLYGMGLILLFGVISGVYPAWKMSRMHPVNALKGIVR